MCVDRWQGTPNVSPAIRTDHHSIPEASQSLAAITLLCDTTMTLAVSNITKDYPTRTGTLSILRDVNLRLNRGDSVAVMGPSGSGKSTLLHILGTLDRPTAGSIALAGLNPFTLPERDLAQFRNRQIGFIFQDHHLLPQCSVLENVLIPTLVNRSTQSRDTESYARTLLDRVGLGSRIDHRPAELSGGERQRVAVARALILKPVLLLADEPTGNLDRNNAEAIGSLLLDLHQHEQTILVVVTHSKELASLFAQRHIMNEGKLEAA